MNKFMICLWSAMTAISTTRFFQMMNPIDLALAMLCGYFCYRRVSDYMKQYDDGDESNV